MLHYITSNTILDKKITYFFKREKMKQYVGFMICFVIIAQILVFISVDIKHCILDNQTKELLHQVMIEPGISARGYNK